MEANNPLDCGAYAAPYVGRRLLVPACLRSPKGNVLRCEADNVAKAVHDACSRAPGAHIYADVVLGLSRVRIQAMRYMGEETRRYRGTKLHSLEFCLVAGTTLGLASFRVSADMLDCLFGELKETDAEETG